jgi:RNA polymerase sigma-70 factor, ECF subfamily
MEVSMVTTQTAEPPETAVPLIDEMLLIQQAKQDLNRFGELYQRHVTQVYRYLLFRVGNVDDAQDLTSQTFMAAMQGLRRYRAEQPFIAWLLGIARNKTADFYRQRRPDRELDLNEALPDIGDGVEELIGRQLAVEQVVQKLRILSPDRAEAVSLRLLAGLEVAEIAHLMEKNEAAVRMLVFRGLRDLQDQLGDLREENND